VCHFNNLHFPGPVIINNGKSVENQSIINDFSDNDTLTLTCTSNDMFDVVEWIMINQTGTVQKQFTNTTNVSSSVTFTKPSDNFTLYLRCDYSHHRYLHEIVFVTVGKFIILDIQCTLHVIYCRKSFLLIVNQPKLISAIR